MADQVDAESLVVLQYDRLDNLKGMLRNYRKDSESRKTKNYLQLRIEKIEHLIAEFAESHQALVCSSLPRTSSYFEEGIASQFDDQYLELRCMLADALEKVVPVPESPPTFGTANSPQAALQLPKLPVPSFTGKFTEWPAFHDAFERLIHTNDKLNKIQKFHFLKQALPADRDTDIQQMALTENNYSSAWDVIVKRYNNPRLLFMHHMNELFSLPVQTEERAEDIKLLLNTANVCINQFNRLAIPISGCDHWIAHYLSTKLSNKTHQAWELHLGSATTIPAFSVIESFLNDRLVALNIIENRNAVNDPPLTLKSSTRMGDKFGASRRPRDASKASPKAFHITAQVKSSNTCYLCHEAHILRRCPKFLSKDCFERKTVVTAAKLCLNCLSKAHSVSQCPSAKNCYQCGQRHHTLLHFPTSSSTSSLEIHHAQPSGNPHPKLNLSASPFQPGSSTNASITQANALPMASHTAQCATTSTSTAPRKVLLATALVKIVNDRNGQTVTLRALVDQGSEGTTISEYGAQVLGLSRYHTSTDISGVGNGVRTQSKSVVNFRMLSTIDPTFSLEVNTVFVLSSVTSHLPSHTIEPQNWPHLQGLPLADPAYHRPHRIDLIIGADIFASIILPETRIGTADQPVAQKTHLGWILTGNTSVVCSNSVRIHCHTTTMELESLIHQFFELEHIPHDRIPTDEESWCESHFKRTHTRQENGKYLVRLPLKSLYDSSYTLGKSKQIAIKRFLYLERRLQRQPELQANYERGIEEYFELNQISPASTTEDHHCIATPDGKFTVTSCVLPHHAVIKESSASTKVRIVFDASSKTSNGRSLNDILCIGPALQNDLSSVILNWRKYRYAFTADIQKMYRCIDMHADDAQYQRILWRRTPGELKEYCLTTVTFGTASAPYTAIRVLHQLAEDEKAQFPLAAHVLKHEMYVDDVLSGSHSVETALNIRNQLTSALQSAGMELRKWNSNSTILLQGIPIEHTSGSKLLELNSNDTVKTLGIYWQPQKDVFKFQLNFTLDFTATKRSVLSTIARLFDPLGLIAPVIVFAKIILKNVWLVKVQLNDESQTALGWDDPLPSNLHLQWQQFLVALSHINCIAIPRWLQYDPTSLVSIQCHTFCDGSCSAFAACVYLRLVYPNGNIQTQLLIAKSRVTPTKPLTIPRVELCGAVLATELSDWAVKSLTSLNMPIQTYYWTDATIVLHWIRGDPSRWQIWVANRIDKIRRISSPDQWGKVDTLENPADCATRGLTPNILATFNLWWNGPEWLRAPEESWPKFNLNKSEVDESTMEIKHKAVQSHFTICQDSPILKFSSWTKTLRVCAYLFRFRHNCRVPKVDRSFGALTVAEIQRSLYQSISLVHMEVFPEDIKAIRLGLPLPSKSKLSNLTPFLDEHAVVRVRGRIERAKVSFAQKHPIILPHCHHITSLLIDNAHKVTLHGGVQLTLTYLRQRFWIINGRRAVAQQLRKCITCFRNRPVVATQLMGDLPFHRVNPPLRPFIATGIDYTGAIELTASRYRGNTKYKGYIAIFICLATKAVHLEAVTGLTTENFLWALQRFIGRRGVCKDIYSDCGTNFVGAEKFLQVKSVNDTIIPHLANQSIQWHFNPPHSPNFGGLWEANVKATKHHLKRVTTGAPLTYEQLSTLLVRIEACLNSRPLCPLTSDPDDLAVLTPGHFLIGDSLLAPPEASSKIESLSRHYLQIQQLVRTFWQRWSSDWLSHLQSRPKWAQQRPNLELNDLVIIKDDRVPPNEWILGRITELHPGADNLVRVVSLRTKNGLYKRSISKLCPLPISKYENNQ